MARLETRCQRCCLLLHHIGFSIPLLICAQPLLPAVVDVCQNIQNIWTEVHKNLEASASMSRSQHFSRGQNLVVYNKYQFRFWVDVDILQKEVNLCRPCYHPAISPLRRQPEHGFIREDSILVVADYVAHVGLPQIEKRSKIVMALKTSNRVIYQLRHMSYMLYDVSSVI